MSDSRWQVNILLNIYLLFEIKSILSGSLKLVYTTICGKRLIMSHLLHYSLLIINYQLLIAIHLVLTVLIVCATKRQNNPSLAGCALLCDIVLLLCIYKLV